MKIINLILILVFSISSYALDTWSETKQIYTPKECSKSNTCDLESFKVETNEYRFNQHGDRVFGTKMFATVTLKPNSNYKKYVVVQFIKGCAFSTISRNGVVENRMNISREFQGEKGVVMNHPEWIVDSFDIDPVYGSYGKRRYALARTNKVKGSKNHKTESYLYKTKGKLFHDELYVRDLPARGKLIEYAGGSFEAWNTSFKFKACLFQAKDVSADVPNGVSYKDAIKCFDWKTSYVYDLSKGKFDSSNDEASFCK